MKVIRIKDFGPIHNLELAMDKNVQVFIGAQASGKSTICKTIYFGKKIRDYTLEFLMDSKQFSDNHPNEYFNAYIKTLIRKFMGCFGTTKHMQMFKIEYEFTAGTLSIELNKEGYARFHLPFALKKEIDGLIQEVASFYNQMPSDNILYSMNLVANLENQMRYRLNHIFEDDEEIVYIPAGRSLLAIMSEQLHDFSTTDMDLTMQEFVDLIRKTKKKFGTKIPEMVENYTKTIKGQVKNKALEDAYTLITQILKADYTNESDGEKIYFDQTHWVKLMYSSSGQQEALWILMLLFRIILEQQKTFVIIEEPEAHLFPVAQKAMIELISLMSNSTNSKVIVTTHSPYILTSMNLLLLAGELEVSKKNIVIPIQKQIRLHFPQIQAYKVEKMESFEFVSIMDEETHLIDTGFIDSVSEITNACLDDLMDGEGL